jgi:mannose-6-phosphate isomerase-like protein (cupin superfamily)
MKKSLLIALAFITLGAFAQGILKLKKQKPHKEFENILVKKVSDDKNQTSFMIWVKDEVKLHKHAYHTENLYVVSGKGQFTVGEKTILIKKGDYFTIPLGIPHSLKVTSFKPIQVLSIQSPRFIGNDRIFIN